MAKLGLRTQTKKAGHGLKTKTTQSQINPGRFQQLQLLLEKRGASIPLLGGWSVARRRTTDRRRDPDVLKLQPIPHVDALRLTGPTRFPKSPVEPPTRLIPREHPPRPVRPMSAGSQSHHHHPGIRIAPTRHRLSPVGFVSVGGFFFLRHLFPPLHQPRASPAGGDLPLQSGQAHPRARGGIRHEVRLIQRERWCRFFATIAYPTAAHGATKGNRMRCPSHRHPGTKVRQ